MVAVFIVTGLIGFEEMWLGYGEYIGYTSMILSSSLIFFGIRSYRQNNEGMITFGKAFKIGILIALIAAAMYVIAWMIISTWFYPDFMEHYSDKYLEGQKAKAVSPEDYKEAVELMDSYKEMYKNPLIKAGLTFMEIFPIGLVVTLVSSLILFKKQKVS